MKLKIILTAMILFLFGSIVYLSFEDTTSSSQEVEINMGVIIPLNPDAYERYQLEFPDNGTTPPTCQELLIEHRFINWVARSDQESRPVWCFNKELLSLTP